MYYIECGSCILRQLYIASTMYCGKNCGILKLMLEAAATAFAGSRRATNSYFWALMIEQLEVLGNVLTRFCPRILGLSQRN